MKNFTIRASRCYVLGFTVLLLLVGAAVTPAEAQLRVCNRSNETISVAVAYREPVESGGQWMSRGWFVTRAGDCSVVVGGPLRNRYYYVHGDGTDRTTWGGANRFCTASDRFSYVGYTGCEASGFRTDNFVQVDTADATEFTFNLVPAPSTSFDARREAARDLRVGWRRSTLDIDTWVMRIYNDSAVSVPLQLQCHTRTGASKWLAVTAPANGIAEVGFLEGWPGNFVSGEYCDAFYGSERVWSVTKS